MLNLLEARQDVSSEPGSGIGVELQGSGFSRCGVISVMECRDLRVSSLGLQSRC